MLNKRKFKKGAPVALVTGAGGGLGSALAFCLAQRGYAVLANYHEKEEGVRKVVARIIRLGAYAEALKADVSDGAEVKNMFGQIRRRFGRLDVLVHCAGNIAPALIVRMEGEMFDAVVRTHLKGAFLCMQEAARIMKKQGRGAIVHIGSLLGATGVAGGCNYAAAKAGLIGLAKSAARELGRYGICVNVVFPGYMLTPLGRSAPQHVVRAVREQNVLRRWTNPEDSARMIVELCRCPWISGQVFNFDGRIL